jgi:hypothetical protein
MNTITIPNTIQNAIPNKLFVGSALPASFFWKNIVIEKRVSTNWIQRLYKESIVHDFWTVLTSKVI